MYTQLLTMLVDIPSSTVFFLTAHFLKRRHSSSCCHWYYCWSWSEQQC